MTTTPWPKAICFSLISPLIIVQSSNQTLYSMFSVATRLVYGNTRQAMCMLHTKQQKPVCVYLVLGKTIELSNSSFLNLPRSMREISTFIIQCVFDHFFIIA